VKREISLLTFDVSPND